MEIQNNQYITGKDMGDVCPVFRRIFSLAGALTEARLEITSLGVYEANINGKRVGQFVLAPGWTVYEQRLQVQSYDVTALLEENNEIRVTVGKGWFRSPMPGWIDSEDKKQRYARPAGLIAVLILTYADGRVEKIGTDESWEVGESPVRFSEIYDGERYDASFQTKDWEKAQILSWDKQILIPQEGEEIREAERFAAKEVFRTPAGELVVDFGQEVTGYVELSLSAHSGDRVRFDHGEVLDQDGNFYNENYRGAKATAEYICKEGAQSWHPTLTFFGFRYIRLLEYPGEATAENFTAIAVHSDLKRTGFIHTGNAQVNQLLSNVIWSQLDNFLDVPTDCPQRDERLGWTGDAQVFVKAASLNFDVERFFQKWLKDLAADQRPNGEVGQVIPDYIPGGEGSAAWGDAAVICPWQIYQTYGDLEVLRDQFESMKGWVDFIGTVTTTPNLWTDHFHFGDWLGLDAPEGSYKGSSREDYIASAFYAYSTSLVVKAGKLLGKDIRPYEALYDRIVAVFRKTYPTCNTQTEYVLAVQFQLAQDPRACADALAEMIWKDGCQLRTGFVGTPYLLHVLTRYGHEDLAWKLFLRTEYPSWLYPVTKGATTIWEHWDGIREDGSFWSKDMNSFNHYAYGSVADWLYEQAAGITHGEDAAGFSSVIYEPHPCKELGWMDTRLETRQGTIRSYWCVKEDVVQLVLETPVPSKAVLPSGVKDLEAGCYTYYEIYKCL
ncbi:MAG: glycoside hydrolase family 78 protein [Lachnospiraceae bacterium]|nr:glycoside hydrolase family 78 protein [Lachnospiraceae bacterium]